jgi:hypothetical protein
MFAHVNDGTQTQVFQKTRRQATLQRTTQAGQQQAGRTAPWPAGYSKVQGSGSSNGLFFTIFPGIKSEGVNWVVLPAVFFDGYYRSIDFSQCYTRIMPWKFVQSCFLE